MDIGIENITPAKAEQWLNFNKSNRKLRDGVVEKYASDMRNGKWTTCPVPIAFYEDNDLADGQHRLWAIVESGVAVKMPVARGLQREDGLNIDTGLGRTLVDNARISGSDTGLTNTVIAVARAMEDGTGSKRPVSNAERLEMCDRHKEAVAWAVSNGPKAKLLRNAVVLSAIGRAYSHADDLERLRRFCDVMNSGFSDGESESAAVAIRNYMLMKGATASSAGMWRDTFLKVQNAILYFLEGKKLTAIKKVADEAFPLKGKSRRKARASQS
jgi:hypothetical protein